MKREDVSKIFEGATDEQINALLNINSADIGKAKGDVDKLKADLSAAKETITNMTSELQTLKDSKASAEDWERKFKDLQNDIAEKERVAKEEKEAAEKEAAVLNRFNAVCVDKDGNPLEFAHEAIKADYIRKFGIELDNKDNIGKSDVDIFNALTKDDGAAFKGLEQRLDLRGGRGIIDNGASEPTSIRDALKSEFNKQ